MKVPLGHVGKLAHHGTTTLRVLAIHFRLHIEDLEPEAEVGGDAEECLAYDDEQ